MYEYALSCGALEIKILVPNAVHEHWKKGCETSKTTSIMGKLAYPSLVITTTTEQKVSTHIFTAFTNLCVFRGFLWRGV